MEYTTEKYRREDGKNYFDFFRLPFQEGLQWKRLVEIVEIDILENSVQYISYRKVEGYKSGSK